MKRFITVLSSLLVLPAFAEVAPVYYDDIVEYTDEMIDAEEAVAEEEQQPVVQAKNVSQRNTINRSTSVSRAKSSGTSSAKVSSRAIASSPRSATGSASRATSSRTARASNVISRTPSSRTTVTARGRTSAKPVTARVGTLNNPVTTGTRVTSSASQTVLEDSSAPLYNGRVGTRRATARISTSALTGTTTAAVAPKITEEEVNDTTNNLAAIAELTDYCKAQYAACMDNYCNVLDDSQGRCSCSKNIKNYEKTEQALADATESFQDVVQKIKYIGLTSKQIESLFTETEAEGALDKTDSSKLKNSLDAIKRKIVDVSTPSASSYEATNGLSLDVSGLLSADFTSGTDISSFLGMGSKNTSSIANQRGEQLYKTATNRCKTTVLNSCTAQGIDPNVITNSYDLEIDKQCIAYERSLNEENKQMRDNVTNASRILQQARLMLAQNKNSYDLRGCVAAIDSCMQDDYVCGSDYEYCLDSTGKYISEGSIIPGSMPGIAGGANVNPNPYTDANWISGGMYDLYASWNYGTANSESGYTMKNAWGSGDAEFLAEFIEEKVTKWSSDYSTSATTSDDMATYLLRKIGYIDPRDSNKVHGMCASVMKQCQDYTFKNDVYQPDNEVIRQYLSSVLTKLKVQQDNLLYNYSENCKSDISSCLSSNGYDSAKSGTSSINAQAINACSLQIATCMSVTGYKPSDRSKLDIKTMASWTSAALSDVDTASVYGIDYAEQPTANGYKGKTVNGTIKTSNVLSPYTDSEETWYVKYSSGLVAAGNALCSNVSYDSQTSVTSGDAAGMNCYCRMEQINTAANLGSWVYNRTDSSINDCQLYCAKYCSENMRNSATFRKTLLEAIK